MCSSFAFAYLSKYGKTKYCCEQCCEPEVGHYDHRRTGQHPFGGADRVLPEWIQWGGGGSSRNFPGSIFSGGGVVAEIFRDPYYVGGRILSVNGSGRP